MKSKIRQFARSIRNRIGGAVDNVNERVETEPLKHTNRVYFKDHGGIRYPPSGAKYHMYKTGWRRI